MKGNIFMEKENEKKKKIILIFNFRIKVEYIFLEGLK